MVFMKRYKLNFVRLQTENLVLGTMSGRGLPTSTCILCTGIAVLFLGHWSKP